MSKISKERSVNRSQIDYNLEVENLRRYISIQEMHEKSNLGVMECFIMLDEPIMFREAMSDEVRKKAMEEET